MTRDVWQGSYATLTMCIQEVSLADAPPPGVTAGFCPPLPPGQWEGRVIKFPCVKADIPAEWGERRGLI